jgi:hypothetical protein
MAHHGVSWTFSGQTSLPKALQSRNASPSVIAHFLVIIPSHGSSRRRVDEWYRQILNTFSYRCHAACSWKDRVLYTTSPLPDRVFGHFYSRTPARVPMTATHGTALPLGNPRAQEAHLIILVFRDVQKPCIKHRSNLLGSESEPAVI